MKIVINGVLRKNSMSLIFEYGDWYNLKGGNKSEELKNTLIGIWRERKFLPDDIEVDEEAKDKRYQPFLKFDNEEVKANNFVGFIQNGDEVIEIYPKVFRNHFKKPTEKEKSLMLRHIFYWFSYCRRWRFPFNQASLDTSEITEFPELIIHLIAESFLETVSNQPLTMYQGLEESLAVPKGSVNFKRYISNSISHGNYQNIECDHEPFMFDNKVNRIIKYCARLLLNQTKFAENIRLLQEVIFILDEVEDTGCSLHYIESTSINSFFQEYSKLMDCCKLILSNHLYSSKIYELTQWCLLFPMEYIFEDFIAGFLEKHFSKDWVIEYQKSDLYLSNNPKAFNMKHDIFLTSKHGSERKIIVDTKYKLRDSNFKSDPKKGIAQNDLYQMVSYAFKRGCTDVILIYPNLSDNLNEPDSFEIISGFKGKESIRVKAIEIPFFSVVDFENLEYKLCKVLRESLDAYQI